MEVKHFDTKEEMDKYLANLKSKSSIIEKGKGSPRYFVFTTLRRLDE